MKLSTSLVTSMLLGVTATACTHEAPAAAGLSVDKTDESSLPSWRYRVAVDQDLSTLTTTLCFHSTAPGPGSLVPGEPECARYLNRAELLRPGNEPLALEQSAGAVLLPATRPGDCVRLVVDAARAARDHASPKIAQQVAGTLVTSPDLWLYRPTARLKDLAVEATFQVPEGMDVAVPWPRQGDRYEVRSTSWRWLNRVIFGPMDRLEVPVPGGVLDVVVLGGQRRLSNADVQAWLGRSGAAVAGLYGRFPRGRAMITVTPVASGGDPVPFGMVVRGGGPAVHLLLNEDARWPTDFDNDWVSVHEMSHLSTPKLGRGGSWLSEGVATYYQNVLRVRAGLMTERQAWEKFHEGFERGRASGRRGLTLADACKDMWTDQNFLRVYWSGTAWALLSDVALRTRKPAASSFDLALSGIAECCFDQERSWPPLDVARKMDEAVGGGPMTTTAQRLLAERAFPDLDALYRTLGLRVDDRGRLHLSAAPDAVALRRAILRKGKDKPLERR